MSTRRIRLGLLVGLAVWMASAAVLEGARERRDNTASGDRQAAFEAGRLLDKAQEYLRLGENERGLQMLQSIVDRWPANQVRFQVWLVMGRHFMEMHKWAEAIPQFTRLQELKKPDQELTGDALDWYLESLYQRGVCYYQISQYDAAFPVLRKITRQYPNTVWANQAYYYIGMCHFAKENWNRAIESLALVGTFVDFDSPTVEYAEAGRRFYIKATDDDLPVIKRLGRSVTAMFSTSSGDREKITLIPLTTKADIYIGSLASAVGVPVPDDNRLSVLSGDLVTATYVDENTKVGERNVPRTNILKVVSSGSLQYTLATLDEKAIFAFQGRNLTMQLSDADLDTTPAAEVMPMRLIARSPKPKKEQDDDVQAVTNLDNAVLQEKPREEDLYDIRDEITINLSEVSSNAVFRSGIFRGMVPIAKAESKDIGDRSDDVLSCAVGDEVVAIYKDAYHIGGAVPREVRASIKVAGEIDSTPSTRQHYVADPDLRAKKSLVEAQAFLELGKIFQKLGLLDGAKKKCMEGVVLADGIIREKLAIKPLYKEQAFKIKWELYLTMGDLGGALATCQFFSKLFPESRFVDQALLRIGDVYVESRKFGEAIKIYTSILKLPASLVKADAQFKIAEATEKQMLDQLRQESQANKKKGQAMQSPELRAMTAAMPAYRRCAELYPDSEFAGESLAKVVDYYVMTSDFAQAEDLLEKVFQEYPDSKFLDRMLLKWVLVAYKRGDHVKAYEKCQQLLFEYPGSQYANTARKMLPQIRKVLNVEVPEESAVSEGGAQK